MSTSIFSHNYTFLFVPRNVLLLHFPSSLYTSQLKDPTAGTDFQKGKKEQKKEHLQKSFFTSYKRDQGIEENLR